MKPKIKDKIPADQSINTGIPSNLDEELENWGRFLGKDHRKHTRRIFHKDFKYIHDKIDEKSKEIPGNKHRIYMHNADSIKDVFEKKEEILVGYTHLLGDFIADYLPDIFKIVLTEIENNAILPPQILVVNGEPSWDIKEEVINDMIDNLGTVLINILKEEKRKI